MDYSYSSCSSSKQPNHGKKLTHEPSNLSSKRGKGKTVKLSTDPQSVAARERRHRISDRFKILQSLVPGGSKMDTVSMLEEAIQYVKFLKTQIWLHQAMINHVDDDASLVLPTKPLPPPQQTDVYYPPMSFDSQVHPMPQVGFPDYYCFQEEETMSYDYGAHMNMMC